MRIFSSDFFTRIRVAAGDALHTARVVFLPSDRPSAIYPVLTVIINGGALVWSFAVAMASSCTADNTWWLSLGIVNMMLNMLFVVLLIFFVRRSIKQGISKAVSQVRFFLRHPLVILYMVLVVWEIVWLAVVAQKGYRRAAKTAVMDSCSAHFNVQVGFLVSYLLVGALAFSMTFATEWLHPPQWRYHAELLWDLVHHGADGQGLPMEDLERGGAETMASDDDASTTLNDYSSMFAHSMDPVRPTEPSRDRDDFPQ